MQHTIVDCKGCMHGARIVNEGKGINGLYCLLNGLKIEKDKPIKCPCKNVKNSR